MSMFILSQDVHITNQVLNSALNKLIHIPAFDTVTYGRNSIRYHCAKLWNDMFPTGFIQVDADRKKDVHLSKINSIHYFKKILKKHFLYKYSADDEDFIYYWLNYSDSPNITHPIFYSFLMIFLYPILLIRCPWDSRSQLPLKLKWGDPGPATLHMPSGRAMGGELCGQSCQFQTTWGYEGWGHCLKDIEVVVLVAHLPSNT